MAAQRVDEMPGTVGVKADHVDHGVGRQVADLRAEISLLFGRGPIDAHLLHHVPSGMGLIGRALPAADDDHFMSPGDQSRHQIGADMAGGADHDNSHFDLSLRSTEIRLQRKPHQGISTSIPIVHQSVQG